MWRRNSPDTALEEGLTLLEVVVATAIFAVTVASLLVLRTRAIRHTARAKNERLACELAARILEEIHAGKDYDEGAEDVFDAERYPGFAWRIEAAAPVTLHEPGAGGAGTRPPPGAGKGGQAEKATLRRYVVAVTYPSRLEEGGTATLRVVTYVLREKEGKGLAGLLGGGGGGRAAGETSGR